MKQLTILLFIILSALSCTNRSEKNVRILKLFEQDTLAQAIIYSNLDTLEGKWILRINKQEAIRKGVPEEIYDYFIKNMDEVNLFNERRRNEDPDITIHFHFPDQIEK